MENTSSFRPIAVQAAGFQETISFFEEEVISNQLLLSSLVHTVKRVKLAFKITCKGSTGLDYPLHYFITLLVGNTWSKRVVSKVSSDTDASRLNHSCSLFRKRWAVELICIHVWDVFISWLVAMIVLNYFVKESIEGLVWISWSSIAADTGVNILATRKDASFERDTDSILLVVVLTPDILGEDSADRRFAVSWELRESNQLLRIFQLRSTLCASSAS